MFLCTRVNQPTRQDERKIDRVIGFISISKFKKRILTGKGVTRQICAYVDALFSTHPDRKGHIGLIIMWENVEVVILSRKQKIATKDSTKLNLVAMSDMFERVEWAYEYLVERRFIMDTPKLYCDNTSTITIVRSNERKPLRNRHLTARQGIMHEVIYTRKFAHLEHKYTEYMIADAMTKSLTGTLFTRFMNAIMGWTKLHKA